MLLQIFDEAMKQNSGVGLRNRLTFQIAHFCLMRGDNVRKLELSDLQHQYFDNEGFTKCISISLQMARGKTNRYNRKESAAFLRHKDVRLCPVSGLALYLFYR